MTYSTGIKNKVILVASIILFIELLDVTILYACSVPVANAMGIEATRMSLPILAYLVGTCLFIPCTEWLSRQFDSIKLLIFSLIVFAILSACCGFASGFNFFVICRFLQGVSISIAASISLVILLNEIAKAEMAKTIGIINVPAILGTAVGPLLGAVFSFYVSWRVAFLINVPVCLALIVVLLGLPKFAAKGASASKVKLDVIGLCLVSFFLIASSIALDALQQQFTVKESMVLLMGVTAGVLYVLVWRNRLQKNLPPSILDMAIFQDANFKLGALVNLFARTAMCGMPVLLSILLQKYYHFTVIQSGCYLAVIAVGAIFAKYFSAELQRIGIHQSMVYAVTFTAGSILLFSPIHFLIQHQLLWLVCFCFGFSMSLLYTLMNSVLYLSLDNSRVANATSIATMIQQFSIGLGVVFAVGGFHFLLASHQDVAHSFRTICEILSVLMLCNLIIAGLFYIPKMSVVAE